LTENAGERNRLYQHERRKRLNLKTISFEVPAELQKRLRSAAKSAGKSHKAWITALIRSALAKKNRP
jgi:predicted HicB family RNase H-like nuclease